MIQLLNSANDSRKNAISGYKKVHISFCNLTISENRTNKEWQTKILPYLPQVRRFSPQGQIYWSGKESEINKDTKMSSGLSIEN